VERDLGTSPGQLIHTSPANLPVAPSRR
jgi:hypothetical protein